MNTLFEQLYGTAEEPPDPLTPTGLQNLYTDIQELWATEYPTLDLTEEPHFLVALPKVSGIYIDTMGLLHYDLLTK